MINNKSKKLPNITTIPKSHQCHIALHNFRHSYIKDLTSLNEQDQKGWVKEKLHKDISITVESLNKSHMIFGELYKKKCNEKELSFRVTKKFYESVAKLGKTIPNLESHPTSRQIKKILSSFTGNIKFLVKDINEIRKTPNVKFDEKGYVLEPEKPNRFKHELRHQWFDFVEKNKRNEKIPPYLVILKYLEDLTGKVDCLPRRTHDDFVREYKDGTLFHYYKT